MTSVPKTFQSPVGFSVQVWCVSDELFSISLLAQYSSLEPWIGNRAADREVIDHLSRESARIPARSGFPFVLPQLPQARKMLFAGFGNHRIDLALVWVPRRRTA
jgi:hypothetical protein